MDPLGDSSAPAFADEIYGYAGAAPSRLIDPSGFRPLSFTFDAFIHKRFGKWIPETPGAFWYFVQTDYRDFGELGGTSKARSDGWIESSMIGSIGDAHVSHTIGFSHRFPITDITAIESREGTFARRSHAIYNTIGLNRIPNVCNTVVRLTVTGRYAFNPWWLPGKIDYDVRFSFEVVGRNRVKITVNGVHDAFPNYEAIADDTLLYAFDTPWSGPALGLTLGHLFGSNRLFVSKSIIVNAETPEECAGCSSL